MNLVDGSDGWFVAMDGGRVQRIEIDFRLGLLFGDKTGTASLYIETSCYLRGRGPEILLTPDEPSSLSPILPFFNAPVAGVAIRKSGQLVVMFDDESSLVVDPDEAFESWQMGSTGAFLLVCGPGGAVSHFREAGVGPAEAATDGA